MERWPGMMAACGDKRAANLVAEARAVGAPVVTGVQPTRLSAEQTDVVLTALVDAGELAVTVGSDRLLEEVDAAARAMGWEPRLVHVEELTAEQRERVEAAAAERGVDLEQVWLQRPDRSTSSGQGAG